MVSSHTSEIFLRRTFNNHPKQPLKLAFWGRQSFQKSEENLKLNRINNFENYFSLDPQQVLQMLGPEVEARRQDHQGPEEAVLFVKERPQPVELEQDQRCQELPHVSLKIKR